jgi:hypothetical protein
LVAASDDDLQNASIRDDESVTNGEEDSVVSQGMGTPVKKFKKRREGSEAGSAKKKPKIAIY